MKERVPCLSPPPKKKKQLKKKKGCVQGILWGEEHLGPDKLVNDSI